MKSIDLILQRYNYIAMVRNGRSLHIHVSHRGVPQLTLSYSLKFQSKKIVLICQQWMIIYTYFTGARGLPSHCEGLLPSHC